MKFGKLTVREVYRNERQAKYYAYVDCDCGTSHKPVRVANLTDGRTKSCGCIRADYRGSGQAFSPFY